MENTIKELEKKLSTRTGAPRIYFLFCIDSFFFNDIAIKFDKQNGTALIPVSSLRHVFSTKEELYNLLKEEGRYYLPPLNKTPIAFLKDVMMQKKKLILNKDLSAVDKEIPRYEELSVKYLWPLIKKDRVDLMRFFPDYSDKKLPDKTYLFNILNTEDSGNLESLLEQAKKFRKELAEEKIIEEEEKVFEVNSEHILSLITKSEKVTKKKGTIGNILKKIRKPVKPRKRRFEVKLVALNKIETKKIKPEKKQN